MKSLKTFVITLLLAFVAADASAQTSRRKGGRRPGNVQPAVSKPAQPTAPVPSPTPVAAPSAPVLLAIVNGQNVTTAEIDPKVREEVEALELRIAQARGQVLDLQVNTLLLESEAAKRKISSQQLYDQEVTKKITEPSAVEIAKFIEDNGSQIDQSDPAATRQQVVAYLKSESERELSEQLVNRLRSTNAVVNSTDPGTPGLAPAVVITTVAGRPITAGALNERLKPIAYKLRFNSYTLTRQALDVTINDLLLLAEASKRGVPPEEIIRKEISEKVRPPSEAEVKKFYEENKARIPGEFSSVSNQIASYLEENNRKQLEQELSDRLRKGANIRVMITEPALPVQTVSVDDDPVRGPANAPVTIVEFTDFQCPSCAAMQPLLEEVIKSYGNKVRLVVRDFPLAMHPNARKAAEAGNAAHAQGKFFEYVDLLLKRQKDLDVPSLKKYASEIGLDRAKFDAALDSGKYAAEVRNDIRDGELYGVDSTPAVFINGIALTEMSIEALRAAIDRALGAAANTPKTND